MIHLTRSRLAALLAGVSLLGGMLASLLSPASALAAEPKHLGTFKDWNAFAAEEGGSKLCYMATQPKKSEYTGKGRGEVYLTVTHRPKENQIGIVNVTAGFTFKPDSEAIMTIGKTTFKLYTSADGAWARDDKPVITAMKNGSVMTVKGASAKGTQSFDTFSLAGMMGALGAINEACGIKN